MKIYSNENLYLRQESKIVEVIRKRPRLNLTNVFATVEEAIKYFNNFVKLNKDVQK